MFNKNCFSRKSNALYLLAAKHPFQPLTFIVLLDDEPETTLDIYTLLFNRVSTFCNEYQSLNLSCCPYSPDFPNRIVISERKGLNCCEKYLPSNERHFLVDITITSLQNQVQVELTSYCYSFDGIRMVNQIREALPPEITRSNRKWKRRKQKTS